jgi:membrane protein DedA with SNARE-associated domain
VFFLAETILNYLTTLGLAGLLAGVFIEAMGLPFPGGIMVVLTGLLIGQGRLNFIPALATAFTGYTAGAFAAYLIGRYGGRPFLTYLGKIFRIAPEGLDKTISWLDRSAAVFILFGRFLPGVSNLTPYLAGVSRIGPGFFLFYNSIFTLGWGTLYLLLGMFFGHNYGLIAGYLNKSLPLAGLALLLSYFVFLYVKKTLLKKAEKSKTRS